MKTPEDEAFEEIERIQRTRTRWVSVKKPQDEIIALGIQAGLCDEFGSINMEYDYKDQILAFAKLVAAKEREACEKICEKHAEVYASLPKTPTTHSAWAACIDLRDAIRARGEA